MFMNNPTAAQKEETAVVTPAPVTPEPNKTDEAIITPPAVDEKK
jgi:hypothetical protein